ncbi:hypothetical protein POVCU2_0042570 [Plasmodium ovale curtisi]|uniref:Uncharacterized protein n=1 Tax=Plasmodium ovale curtisi TaxID=864141 RepID=A0A1A8W6W0_PLAOA|nr:hypothetical protein POVCU2_0042570 [Plasmodium ovale curtisi]
MCSLCKSVRSFDRSNVEASLSLRKRAVQDVRFMYRNAAFAHLDLLGNKILFDFYESCDFMKGVSPSIYPTV